MHMHTHMHMRWPQAGAAILSVTERHCLTLIVAQKLWVDGCVCVCGGGLYVRFAPLYPFGLNVSAPTHVDVHLCFTVTPRYFGLSEKFKRHLKEKTLLFTANIRILR